MTTPGPDRKGKSRLLPTMAGLFFLAWTVAVFFAIRDTFVHDRRSSESAETGALLALPDSGKGRYPILDRSGRELAVSFPTKSVYARPLEVQHPDAVALFLARELGLSERELKRNLKEERSFVWLGRQISEAAVDSIRARKLRGIYVVDESQRFYPQGNQAAQLLGLARDGRGLDGIEAQYDQQLQTVVDLPDENGQLRGPLVLTIDLRIQELVERELAQLVGETGATGGQGIVLDPRSGEVLALVNRPTYDPNFFWDSDENSRTNRVLSLALPASGFEKLLRMAASPQPVEVAIPAAAVAPSPPGRDRLASLKKELRRAKTPGTFGSGPNRLVPFKGGYLSRGLAGLEKVAEPPGFSAFLASLGFGQKVLLELPVGTVEKAAVGDMTPSFMASGGELLVALAGLTEPDGAGAVRVVAGVADPQTGRVQPPLSPAGVGAVAAETVQRVRDYLARLAAGTDGAIFLEELSEVHGPVEENPPAEPVAPENDREVGQVWEPERALPAVPAGATPAGVGGGEKTANPPLIGAPGANGDGQESAAAAQAEPRRFISLLVALPGSGEVSGVMMLLALEGAILDADRASPVRLAAERMLPQIRSWAADSIGPPDTISWSPNESLWLAQWQKAQAGRDAQATLSSRANRRQMPDLRGASLRKALQVLNQYDLKVRIQGVGRVVEQRPEAGTTLNGDECVLILSGLNLINERPDRQLAVGVESGSDKLKIYSTVYNPRPVVGVGN